MISNWKTVTIGDLLSHRKGFAFKSTQYTTEGRKIARVSNFTQRSIDTTGCNCIDEKEANEFSDYSLKAGDVVIATVGSWPTNPASVVGRAIRVPDEAQGLLLNQNAVRLRSNEHLSQQFLYYLLSADHYQNFIVSTAQGSASQASIKLNDIFSYQALIPPPSEQEAIVSVVSALDDKIENNRRMNETLEEMARAIFKSWFVDFDPVHAKAAGNALAHMDADTAALFPSSFGDDGLPVGWTNKTLGDFVEIQNGYAFKSNDWTDDGVPVVKIGSVKPSIVDLSNSSFVSAEMAEQKQNFKLDIGDILVGLTGYVGEVGRVPPSDIMPMLNQRVGRVIFKSGIFEPFIYAAMRIPEFKLFAESQSQGSAQANVSTKQLKGFPLIAADNSLIEKYNALTSSYFKKILINFAESKTLTELRDTLLPKLMSGEIRVKDAESEMEAAV